MCQELYKIIERHYKIKKYICPLWWLILYVNLTGLRYAPKAGKMLFLDMLMKLPLEEVSIWIDKLSEDHPHQVRWASLNPLRVWIEQEVEERANSLFRKLGHTFSPVLDISTPGSQAFGLKMGLRVSFSCSQCFELILNYTMRFLGAPAWGQLIMEFLSLHNGMSKFL